MSTVTSAYNFVPINEKVCLPAWADAVSQDVPLQGAVSGVIDLTITAKTPIFVRGQSTVPDQNVHQEYEFMKHDDRFCIPGSSIKGTIANVLEILSFGKLNRINDHRFSQRDWENSGIYDKQSFARENKGGWLYYDEDEDDKCYKIDYSTNSIGRITHEAIDAHYKTDFQTIFGKNFDPKDTGENKSARKKYKLIEDKKLLLENKFASIPEKDNLYVVAASSDTVRTGTLVFSGQPSKREKDKIVKGKWRWKGKNKEFIFWESDVKGVKVDDRLIEDFLFAYYDHDPKQMTTDWEHWREVLAKGGRVPVFLQLDDNNNMKHFGLSMLYKLPYKNSIKDLIPDGHSIEGNDFVETLFGYSKDTVSTKGRVSFLPAFADENAQELTEKTLVLGEPKASYYPFYLKQEFRNNSPAEILRDYQTYNNRATLAGRKRYPIKEIDENLGAEKSAFSTTFKPLASGTQFSTKIVYHNLLPVELGALLCALTFNGVEDCHHGIGMAKPYGYSAVAINMEMDIATRNNALLAFRAYMEAWWKHHKIKGTWSESEQLQQLVAMARFPNQTTKLSYMELKMFPVVKKLIKDKKGKEALPRFTNFLNIPKFAYSETYTKELEPLIAIEKEHLEAIEKRALEEAAAIAEEQKRKEHEVILQKGLILWLPNTDDYGILKEKMNGWLAMRNDEFITDKVELEYLIKIILKIRGNKPSRRRKTFFSENKRNDLIKWIGNAAAEKLIADFNQ